MTKKTPKTTAHEGSKKVNSTPDEHLSDEEWEKALLMTDERMKELGLVDRDDLVISFNPLRRTN